MIKMEGDEVVVVTERYMQVWFVDIDSFGQSEITQTILPRSGHHDRSLSLQTGRSVHGPSQNFELRASSHVN